MIQVTFPQPAFRIKEDEGKELIFDEIRKQWVRLTPEEWVRQNLLQYLIQTKKYPAAFIGVEKEISLAELKKRFDVLIYDSNHQPWMMIECKAMDVELSEKVLEQIVRYNMSVPVPYLVISNGSYTYAWVKKENRLISITDLPEFE
ncbi:type I restriction enzyme HsdR N-terminal domain-containing protein [Lacibacter luteus]|uniref:Type I restriction enzyme HsdR N-terminal domain-containing protein n=1 Tax=Lacibacter luteus TaxID=2508719 RepID=A0A4Q1CNH1_9BACT|nr:type I restriction enzyme HsdR N-terminal domain-containing protein [Lacibacter luteus]RXK62285.1 type I restriction enzyme HsdR N-terminal domain-containing protein [Lacibacter luteus]